MEQKPKTYSVKEIRKTTHNAYKPWSREDDEKLVGLYQKLSQEKAPHIVSSLSQIFQREPGAIRSRIKKMGLSAATVLDPSTFAKASADRSGRTPQDEGKENSGRRQNDVSRDQRTSGKPVELNPEFAEALNALESTSNNIFITGRAGTGKSTLLTYFRNNTRKNVAVLAPTGVAALNVKGQTIHSFFHFKPGITKENINNIKISEKDKKLYLSLDAIIIDEISMVRSDLLDCIDAFLRRHGKTRSIPFGGIQMIFIGDLYQLSPVVTYEEREIFRTRYQSPYFFDSDVFKTLPLEIIELKKVYRQKDEAFIGLLNAVRNNQINQEQIDLLNARHLPQFEPPASQFYIRLTTTNDLARLINEQELKRLPGKIINSQGDVYGNFDGKSLPTSLNLDFKPGAQIMMVSNDPSGRFVNGSLGKILKTNVNGEGEDDEVVIELQNGAQILVGPNTWELFRFRYDEKHKRLESETVGSFTQYPFMLAWAVTIHKSQGKTFDRVIIDFGNGTFAHGQAYVALSRCTSLSGIVLTRKLEKRHVLLDSRVTEFLTTYKHSLPLRAI